MPFRPIRGGSSRRRWRTLVSSAAAATPAGETLTGQTAGHSGQRAIWAGYTFLKFFEFFFETLRIFWNPSNLNSSSPVRTPPETAGRWDRTSTDCLSRFESSSTQVSQFGGFGRGPATPPAWYVESFLRNARGPPLAQYWKLLTQAPVGLRMRRSSERRRLVLSNILWSEDSFNLGGILTNHRSAANHRFAAIVFAVTGSKLLALDSRSSTRFLLSEASGSSEVFFKKCLDHGVTHVDLAWAGLHLLKGRFHNFASIGFLFFR